MNFVRVAAAGVTAWVVSIPVGYVVNEILLADVYQANAAALRPHDVIVGYLPIGFAFMLLGFLAFAYAYAKGYEGTNGVMEGIRFGVLVAVMVICFSVVWMYVSVPVNRTMAAAMMIDYIVEWAMYGAIVGAVYKPLEKRAGKVAAA